MRYLEVFRQVYDLWPNKIYIADAQTINKTSYLFPYIDKLRDLIDETVYKQSEVHTSLNWVIYTKLHLDARQKLLLKKKFIYKKDLNEVSIYKTFMNEYVFDEHGFKNEIESGQMQFIDNFNEGYIKK